MKNFRSIAIKIKTMEVSGKLKQQIRGSTVVVCSLLVSSASPLNVIYYMNEKILEVL